MSISISHIMKGGGAICIWDSYVVVHCDSARFGKYSGVFGSIGVNFGAIVKDDGGLCVQDQQ